MKRYNNFTVVKKKYSFIVFTKTKQSRNFHVNITKIPSTEHISKALDELKLVISRSIVSSKFIIEVFKVENMTCLYQITTEINLLTFYNNLRLNVDFEIVQKRYDPEKIPWHIFNIKEVFCFNIFVRKNSNNWSFQRTRC